jgi:hypothetical protein
LEQAKLSLLARLGCQRSRRPLDIIDMAAPHGREPGA